MENNTHNDIRVEAMPIDKYLETHYPGLLQSCGGDIKKASLILDGGRPKHSFKDIARTIRFTLVRIIRFVLVFALIILALHILGHLGASLTFLANHFVTYGQHLMTHGTSLSQHLSDFFTNAGYGIIDFLANHGYVE